MSQSACICTTEMSQNNTHPGERRWSSSHAHGKGVLALPASTVSLVSILALLDSTTHFMVPAGQEAPAFTLALPTCNRKQEWL